MTRHRPAGNKIGAIENLGATEVRTQSRSNHAHPLETRFGCGSRITSAQSAARHIIFSSKFTLNSTPPHASRLARAHTHAPPQNQFDSIDLSDNAIVRLEGFSRLPRLKVLYLNNNRVAKIARNLQGGRQRLGGALPASRHSWLPGGE
jgi:Leucine-rich repeat (LRR) protein